MDFMIKKVRLAFPVLFTPEEFTKGDGKPRWGATFLVEPGSDADKAIQNAIAEEAKERWKDKATANLLSFKGQTNKICYVDGNDSKYDGYEGMWALTAHRNGKTKAGGRNVPPKIIDRDLSPLTEESGRPYAGCYVNAKVSIYTTIGQYPGVRASFSVVQFLCDGDAFGAGAPSINEFEALSNGTDADGFEDEDLI